jgi:anti-sigma factor RsiW
VRICDKPKLSLFVDDELDPDDADRIRRHLATCKPCQAELLHHMLLVTRLSSLPPVTG